MKTIIKFLFLLGGLLAISGAIAENTLTLTFSLVNNSKVPPRNESFTVLLENAHGGWFNSTCAYALRPNVKYPPCIIKLTSNFNQGATINIHPLEEHESRILYKYALTKASGETSTPVYNWALSKLTENNSTRGKVHYTVGFHIDDESPPCVMGEPTFELPNCDRRVDYTITETGYN